MSTRPTLRDATAESPAPVRALAVALSLKAKEGGLKIIKNFELGETKTKKVIETLKTLGTGNTLIVDGDNEQLALSARNIVDSQYLHVAGLNVVDLLKYRSLVITESAARAIEQRLLGTSESA